MERLRVLIVDDEPLARQGIARLVELDQAAEVVGQSEDGESAVADIRRLHPDLVMLDIQMPGLDGFEVLGRLQEEELPYVVFVTAFDQYALRAFEAHALDYLLKPLDGDRFRDVLARAKNALAMKRSDEFRRRVGSLLKEIPESRNNVRRVMIRSGGRVSFLPASEIEWIEAQGDYVSLHSRGKRHLIRDTLTNLQKQLHGRSFIRIHRSVMVNVDCIKELSPLFHGDYCILLQNGTRLTLSRSFRESFFAALSTPG